MNIIEKPWGKEEVLERNDRYMVKKLTMWQGQRCSLQLHKYKCETIYVISGTLRIASGASAAEIISKEYYTGDTITIRPGEIHRMEAIDDSIYLEASTPELEDVVRLEDDYKRV